MPTFILTDEVHEEGSPSPASSGVRVHWVGPAAVEALAKLSELSKAGTKQRLRPQPALRRVKPGLRRVSGRSRGFQVVLELPDCAPVQGAEVEVEGGVADVEVSRFFDQIHDLQHTTHLNVRSISHSVIRINIRAGGHVWPDERLKLAPRAFGVISPEDNLRRFSTPGLQANKWGKFPLPVASLWEVMPLNLCTQGPGLCPTYLLQNAAFSKRHQPFVKIHELLQVSLPT